MKLSSEIKKTYPKLSGWIEKNIPKVRNKPKVWRAFVQYSELTDAKALNAISMGHMPEIYFDKMPNSNGQYRGSKFPDRVFLAKEICERFEKVDSKSEGIKILVESTLLHEMVHWGDFKDGKDQPGEEGKAFEREAYGKDINRSW